MARCFAELAVEAALIDPIATSLRAQALYRRFGFEPIRPRRLADVDGLVMRLDRARWRASTDGDAQR